MLIEEELLQLQNKFFNMKYELGKLIDEKD